MEKEDGWRGWVERILLEQMVQLKFFSFSIPAFWLGMCMAFLNKKKKNLIFLEHLIALLLSYIIFFSACFHLPFLYETQMWFQHFIGHRELLVILYQDKKKL